VVGKKDKMLNEKKYLYKKDALTDYFKGKLSAKELDKIAKDNFGVGIATKKELSSFLSNKFTQDVMSDTYGIPPGTLVKRVRGLMKFAEGIGEDTDVGHQDDEPNMLKSTALEIMEYGKKLMDKLDKYDDMEGEVDFPNWWQSKLTLAKDYLQKAYHYLDSEEKTSETIDRSFRTYDDEGDDEGPVDEGKKRYYQQDRVGSAKYTISYHDGKKKHKDGSDFFDIKTFKNKKDLAKFVNTLHKGGYVYGFNESVNEAIGKPTISKPFKSNDRTFDKVYNTFDKRDYFNSKGLAKTQIGNFERALKKNDKGAQQILNMFKGDMGKAKDYITQVISDRNKERAFNNYKAMKSAVDSFKTGKPNVGAVDYVKRIIHNSSQKYSIALYSALRNKKFTKWKDVHNDIDSLIGESVNEAYVVLYSPKKGVKPVTTAAYKDKKDAEKWAKSLGGITMIVKKKVRYIDEDKNQINKIKKQVGKKEIKFYDALSKLEKKMGSRYKSFLDKSLKDFKLNPSKFRTNADKEEKLFQVSEINTNEDLRNWFKSKWVNIGKKDKSGKHPPCGTSGKKRGYAKCVPAAKAATMSKKEKESATRRKRAAQNKAGRGGSAGGGGRKPINVSTHTKRSGKKSGTGKGS